MSGIDINGVSIPVLVLIIFLTLVVGYGCYRKVFPPLAILSPTIVIGSLYLFFVYII